MAPLAVRQSSDILSVHLIPFDLGMRGWVSERAQGWAGGWVSERGQENGAA